MPSPRSPDQLADRITELESRCSIWLTYLEENVRIRNWHGVEDAASDLRDHEAEIRALRWALGNA